MLISLICTILMQFGVASAVPSPQQSPQQFLQLALQAHLRGISVANIQAVGTQTAPDGTQQPFRIYADGSKSIRIERGTGPSQNVMVSSNGDGWFVRNGKTTSIPPHALQQRVTMFPFLDLLSEINNPGLAVTYKDTISQANSTQFRIHLHLSDPQAATRFLGIALDEDLDVDVDPQSMLVVRSQRSNMTIENMLLKVPLVEQFSDYRLVNGVAVPFHIVTTEGTPDTGVHSWTTVLQSVSINSGIAPTLFQWGGQQ